MGGPLLIIGKTHAQETVVSPSHDPGECIVCPLAHGPLEPCGGYSDYDYHNYWYDDYSSPESAATLPADPDLEVAQSLSEDATEEAWESDYDDYYGDYVYGDDTTNADAEDLTLDEAPAPVALIEPAAEVASTPDVPRGEESSELYDEYGWYTDDTEAPADYFDSYDNYEPIETVEPEAVVPEEPSPSEAIPAATASDYEAYEEEWFTYGDGENPSVEAEAATPEADEAYEALSESASAAYPDEAIDVQPAGENWGDEEAWYREEYGYDRAFDEEIADAIPAVDAAEQLETGYDEAYDAAMTTELETAAPVTDILPASPDAESTEAEDYESFYDAYDDLYDFESTPVESLEAVEFSEAATSEVTAEPAVEGPVEVQQATNAEPVWLTELVARMLAPVWVPAESLASNASRPELDSHPAIDVDECAQEWDCDLEYSAQPQAEQPSIAITAADTLDGMAAVLQEAAEFLRGVGGGSLAQTARAPQDGAPR